MTEPKNFIISEQQANQILNTLGKYPAAEVIAAIDILRTLQVIPEVNPEPKND